MKPPRHAPPFQIRPAEVHDAEAILACLAAAFESYRQDYTPAAFADTVLDSQTIRNRMERMALFVAISEQQVIGTIGCEVKGAEGHLRGMAVFPEWQGTGVASALLQAAEDQLRKSGCTYVTLDTTEPLERAMGFYKRHGYSSTGKIFDFFGMRLHEYSKSLV